MKKLIVFSFIPLVLCGCLKDRLTHKIEGVYTVTRTCNSWYRSWDTTGVYQDFYDTSVMNNISIQIEKLDNESVTIQIGSGSKLEACYNEDKSNNGEYVFTPCLYSIYSYDYFSCNFNRDNWKEIKITTYSHSGHFYTNTCIYNGRKN